MQTLAHFGDGGPGPWILLFPLVWALIIGGGIALLRRTVWRGRGGRYGRGGPGQSGPAPDSPITVLGHRFASGEIDEDEYWRRLSVLDEQFGRKGSEGGAA
ncbi:SHOCT domain-containing protein [Streptomyces thermospinosisporus]|uniref:SHOCT domain-containing protein n=1 Tax=Streptomyces thermospinosisporus TaxID=161482 RepID=A0ABP4JEU1_9ACTN